MTRFDSIVDKWTDEEIESAVNFLARFMREEREIREQILEIRIREGTAPESSQIDQSAIRANLDLWMAPWLVDRSSAGRYSVDYDCLDAPNGQLLGAGYIHALVEPDGRVSKAHFNEMFSGFSAEMFRQRIIPAGCGFVENCIADQFITDRIIRFTPDLERLLKQSMVEVESLLREAPNEAHSFLREAIRILRELYDRRCR